MKKTLFTVLIVFLIVLTSCATKKPQQAEVEAEVVEATVVEQVSEEPVLVVEDTPVPAVGQESSEKKNPEIEEAQLVDVAEVAIKEEPREELVSTEDAASESGLSLSDLSYVFTSTDAPVKEDSSSEHSSSEPVAETASASEAGKAERPEKDQAKPAAATASPEKTSAPVAEEESETSFMDKVIYFLSHELLFSIGILICIGGLVYFIVALAKSSHGRKKPAVKDSADSGNPAPEDGSQATQDVAADEDEEDEFLKALLGEDKK